jgi:RNA polymerase sigma factor (sigma-70 family)
LEPDRGGGADAGKDGGGMSEFVQHLEMEGGLAVTTWNDDAPIIGFQVNAFNWRLRRAREAKGWSRAELARQIGLSPGVVGDAERLRPVSDASREKMALALGVPEDILFPGEIDKLPKDGPPQIEISLTREDVTSLAEPDANLDMIECAERQELRSQLVSAVEQLPARERRVIEQRFGLIDGQPRTGSEIAEAEGVTPVRIHQIEQRALRLLRHPSRGRALRSYLPDWPNFGLNPKPGECQRQDQQGTCHDRFEMPGWMKTARAGDLKRPMFLCGPCWSKFLRARAEAS